MVRERPLGFALLMPSILVMGIFILFPLLYVVWLSFNQRDLFTPTMTFVGLDNFRRILADSEFWTSLRTGVIFAGASVGIQVILGLTLSLALNESFAGRGIARTIALVPYMIPTVVAALMWKWVLNDLYGIVNYTLQTVGLIRTPILWFGSPDMALLTVILVNVWSFYPFVVIALLARLSAIPRELYEAAQVDGASVWERFWHVTLPQLKSIILIVILLRGIWMFNKFDLIYLLTRGGPLGSTQHLPILAYTKAFTNFQLGQAAAVAVMIFVILAVTSVLYLRFARPIEQEAA